MQLVGFQLANRAPSCSVALIVLVLLLLLHLYIHFSFYTVLTALLSVVLHAFAAVHMGGKVPMSPCMQIAACAFITHPNGVTHTGTK